MTDKRFDRFRRAGIFNAVTGKSMRCEDALELVCAQCEKPLGLVVRAVSGDRRLMLRYRTGFENGAEITREIMLDTAHAARQARCVGGHQTDLVPEQLRAWIAAKERRHAV